MHKDDDGISKIPDNPGVSHMRDDLVTTKDLTIALLNFKNDIEKRFSEFKLEVEKRFNELERKIDKVDIKLWAILGLQSGILAFVWYIFLHVSK